MSMISLVIADDHAMFRQGLRSLISSAPDLAIIAECGRGNEAFELIIKHRPDVALLDISMPDLDGISVVAKLAKEGIMTPVVILTTHDDPLMLERARCAGAKGYVLKEFAFEELLDTLRTVAAGGSSMGACPELPALDGSKALTDREREILGLIAQGMSNRVIAESLGISFKTVDNHRTNLMAKLKLHSVVDLVRYAIKIGFN